MLGAQSTIFEKAPPGVEEALRDRVQQFYQCFVDRRYRDAVPMVAEDSQDPFFEMQKPHYGAFTIGKINYTDDYSKATVVILVKSTFNFQGHSIPETAPVTSYWKVENGAWDWYLPPRISVDTVFGKSIQVDPRAHAPDAPDATPPDPSAVLRQIQSLVSVTPQQVKVKAHADSGAEVRVSNTGKAPFTISIVGDLPGGLTIDPNPAKVAGGDTVTLRIHWTPPPAQNYAPPPKATIGLKISPLGETIPVEVAFE